MKYHSTKVYPIRTLCNLLNCARSRYYCQPKFVDDVALENETRTVAGQWPTYGYRLRSEFVYLAVIMGVFTSNIRGWHLGRGLDQSLTIAALSSALAQHTPEIHHSDQGVQYAAAAYVEMLSSVGAQSSMANTGQDGTSKRMSHLAEIIVSFLESVHFSTQPGFLLIDTIVLRAYNDTR